MEYKLLKKQQSDYPRGAGKIHFQIEVSRIPSETELDEIQAREGYSPLGYFRYPARVESLGSKTHKVSWQCGGSCD